MNKNIKKILLFVMLFMIIIFYNSIVNAASFSASASKTTLQKGKTATITITAKDCGGLFSITSSDSSVVSVSSSSKWIENESISIKVEAKKEGKATITVKASNVGKSDGTGDVTGSKKISITVQGTSSNSNSNNNETNQPTPESVTEKEPTFTSVNETVYAKSQANVRSSYSTSSSIIGSLKKGDSITRIGIGNNGWSKISYNGKTGYVSSSLITKIKPEESTTNDTNETEENILELDELKISEYELSPEFSKDIYEYKLEIENDIDKLDIEPISNDKDILIEVTGNENLKVGENIITITLKKDGIEKIATYTITATKAESSLEQTETSVKINQDLLNEEINQANKNLKIRQWTIRGIIIFVTILIIIIIILRYLTVIKQNKQDFDYVNIKDKFNELDDIENYNLNDDKEEMYDDDIENNDEEQQIKDSESIEDYTDILSRRSKKSKGKHF